MSLYPTFQDGKRTIDYIIVYKVSALVTESAGRKYEKFIESLHTLGFQLEYETFSVEDDVKFIKLYMPNELISSYAGLFDIDLACETFEYRPKTKPPRDFFATPLTRPNINDPIYARAPDTISGEIPKKITSAERIMVAHEVLTRAIWGDGRSDYGIAQLLKSKVIADAFPLHDGGHKWTPEGPLNDRQLLALYWGSAKNWHKAQPLNLIEKYFGTEYALYFAWLGMYIKHLVPAAIMSIFVILYGLITMFTPFNNHAQHVCNSTIVMCPRCHFSECPMEYLSNSCYVANLTYLFDNWCAVVFAAIMSLWATVFMEFWQREESALQLQWNVKSLEYTISLRPEYLEKATKKKFSSVTGKLEPYVPKKQSAFRYTLTIMSVSLLLIVMVMVTMGVVVYRLTVTIFLLRAAKHQIIRTKFRGIIASVTGALMSGLFIFVFSYIYKQIAFALTNMENHRTYHAHLNAYIYKSYALAFANNYAAVFYVAFFKGKFFTYPGDLSQERYFGGINTDMCDPSGCIVDLAILLIIIMTLKAIANNITQVVMPKLIHFVKQLFWKVNPHNATVPWESDYLLARADDFFIVGEYTDMVIQYGFVNFFIMGFPLAPLFALLNNIAELRVDSSKVTKSYRRPVPTRAAGLGAWFGILQATTYIGVVTNALVIAFTSNFMEKLINTTLEDTEDNVLHQLLSVFAMKDFVIFDGKPGFNFSVDYCHYQGKRYPPSHPLKYKRRKDYWQNLGLKFAVVVIFEHIVIILKGLIAYAIPDVPFSVKQQLINQEKAKKKEKMLEMNKQYLKVRSEVGQEKTGSKK